MHEVFSLSLTEIHERLKNREFDVKDLVLYVLENIKRTEDRINAFITLRDEEEIISEAEKLDASYPDYLLSPLSGIPVAIKDNISVKDMPLTCASRILLGYRAPYDATVVKKLREQNALIVGKTNLDEFAMGSTGEYSYFGATQNPVVPGHVPGGSSSGSAAAVAAGYAFYALGSDTGGSVRLPAFYTGTVGFKPTYGRLSRFGLVAFASSLDQIGIITRNVKDAELVFSHISGYDPKDSTSYPVESYSPGKLDVRTLKIGVPYALLEKVKEEEIKSSVLEAIEKFKSYGIEVKEVSLPYAEHSVVVYQVVSTSEASSNLSRYDGVRYGLRIEGDDLIDTYFKTRGEGFGKEVKRRILLGTFALSSGYYDEYYARAQKLRRLIKENLDRAFQDVDAILLPTAPEFPPKLGEGIKDPVSLYLLDIFTTIANLAGIPAISLPTRRKSKAGFPLGFQLMSNAFSESRLFALARLFEEELDA